MIAVCGFGGDARFVPGTLEEGSLLMLAQANSLKVVNKISDKDRMEMERAMFAEVLEAERYPEIVFMSTNISTNPSADGQYQARITGDLSLHGVTRSQLIDALLTMNGNSLRAQGEFSLRQTDYNIRPVSVAGGTLKMKDELKLSFDIWAGRS